MDILINRMPFHPPSLRFPSLFQAVLIFLCLFEIVAYSNLKELVKLVALQEKQLLNPLDNNAGEDIRSYNLCVQIVQEMHHTFNIFSPRYIFGVQDFEYELDCRCNPQERPMTWTQVTFENSMNVVAQRDGRNSRLILETKPQMSIYYCSWKFKDIVFINNVWLVEIVASNTLDKVRAISWKDPEPYFSPTFRITISSTWNKWSLCNKCGKAGKRHRFGYCNVEKTEETDLPIVNILGNVSCSTLLKYNPEIAQDETSLTEELMAAPVVMIGYCKVSCKFYGNSFEKAVSADVRLMYTDNYPTRELGNKNIDTLVYKYSWISKVPDIILLILLLGFLMGIFIHVVVNRKHAQ